MQVSEVGESLYPEICVLLGTVFLVLVLFIDSSRDAWVSAPFKNLFSCVVMDIKREQLLSQVQALATIFYTVLVAIDLEKKQDVVFVNLSVAVILLKELLDLLFDTDLFRLSCTAQLSFGLKRLVFIQVAF